MKVHKILTRTDSGIDQWHKLEPGYIQVNKFGLIGSGHGLVYQNNCLTWFFKVLICAVLLAINSGSSLQLKLYFFSVVRKFTRCFVVQNVFCCRLINVVW